MRSLLSIFLVAAGCAQTFQLPMTAAQLAVYDSGPALVAYLGQADATPTVCDLRAQGPHVAVADDEMRGALLDGLDNGKIEPALWRRCASALLRSAPAADERAWLDGIGRSYEKLMKRSDFEKVPALQERVRAMQQLYIDRRQGLNGNRAVDDKLIAQLRRALATRRLGPIATQLGEELIDVVDIEQGQWQGRTIDVPLMDRLYASKDDKTLARFANRLPNDALRDEAKRRVVRLHIAASPYDEVRAHAAEVEAIVMKDGINALSLGSNAPIDGSIDTTKVPMRGVLVRQNVLAQQATLLGYSGDRPGVSVLPEMNLKGALLVHVAGYAKPVTLCGHKKSLDPSPCIQPSDVHIDNPDAYLDQGGAFHFTEHIGMTDAVDLAKSSTHFVLPIRVGNQRLCSFDWRLYYERPADVVLSSDVPGSEGPNLGVLADHRDPNLYIFTISGVRDRLLVVIEQLDIAAFHIASSGAQGFAGESGSSGSSGASGGECSNGSDGSSGGDGGPGGPGGPGGAVEVDVRCSAACDVTVAQLQRQVSSVGGAGGPGGAGGAGGTGGAGGPGRAPTTHTDSDGNTVTDDPGCAGGSSGANGSDGSAGPDGPPGFPGIVRVAVR